jgi:hypothetical protein
MLFNLIKLLLRPHCCCCCCCCCGGGGGLTAAVDELPSALRLPPSGFVVIELLRRHCCCCCCHLTAAVDELPSALRLPPSQFRHRYHFEPPGPDDVLVMQSRMDCRARWASQLARDAGYTQ